MKAIIIFSDKFLDRVGIFMKIGGISLFPFVVLREKYNGQLKYWRDRKKKIINHESIHIAQQGELLVIPFYIIYILEWFVKLFFYGKKAYYNISFEREAYANEYNYNYLENRKSYAWLKYIFNK
tara:strand:+ start:740 stop:1111 length:372 start_codon:yes stop_codon:yes gene_type:complete